MLVVWEEREGCWWLEKGGGGVENGRRDYRDCGILVCRERGF